MPPQPIRILHLSDFQVGKEPDNNRVLFKPIIDLVRARKDAGAPPDLVCITGDIAYSAQPEQYQEFTDRFLFELSTELGDDIWNRTFVVPGNHDVDRNKSKSIELRTVLNRVPYLLDPDQYGYAERKSLIERFRAFGAADLPYSNYSNQWLFSEFGYDIHKITLQEQQIGILRLNTAWLSDNGNDRRLLSPGVNMTEAGLGQLKDCDVRLVLGHHPVDWFIDEEANELYELLRQNQAIYLHGHADKRSLGQEEGVGKAFLSLRAGAAFKPRGIKEYSFAGIAWYELDMPSQLLLAETLRWDAEKQLWLFHDTMYPKKYYNTAAERWKFVLNTQNEEATSYSDGWELVNTAFLARHQTDPSDERTIEQVLHYFDGGQPDWRIILAQAPQADGNSSLYLPQRAMVDELKQALEDARERGGVDITLLTGAIGEGKSTVLRQVMSDLARDSERWTVIWHNNPEQPLHKKFLINELPRSRVYLIVSDFDDTENTVKNVFNIAAWLRASNHRNFHFLLCCRDTDWIAAKGKELRQDTQYRDIPFTQKTIKGLTLSDATMIVKAWQRLGKPGLRDLYTEQFDIKLAAQRFVNEARSESYTTTDAFLGALLRVRFGNNLKEHVEQLLWKLRSRSAPPKPNGNLLDAFAYIAAMHAENQLILSKPVLAEALHCTIGELQEQVIKPLGAEAFVSTGQLMLTRHRLIAKAAMDILSTEMLGELGKASFDVLYAELVCAAEQLRLNGAPREHVEGFRQLPEALRKNGNAPAGIHAARELLKRWPAELGFLVELSKLYRRDNTPDQAARLFTDPSRSRFPHDRACYNEWATAEGMDNRPFLDIWLSGVALADGIERSLKLKMAVMALNGLTIAFHRVFISETNSQERLFIEACAAAAKLARQLDFNGTVSSADAWRQVNECKITYEKHGVNISDANQAMERIEMGIHVAWSLIEGDLPDWDWIPHDNLLAFADLRRIVGA